MKNNHDTSNGQKLTITGPMSTQSEVQMLMTSQWDKELKVNTKQNISVAANHRHRRHKSTQKPRPTTDMDLRHRHIESLTSRGRQRVNQPPAVATWTSSTLSPSENKGTLAGRGQRTRQLNGLASTGTPSPVTRCAVQTTQSTRKADVVPRSYCPSLEVCPHPGNYDTSEASHRKQRFRHDGKPVKKREADTTRHHKWWTNEEPHRRPLDKPSKTAHHWHLKYLLTQTSFLVIAQWRFHSTWPKTPFPKTRRKKNINRTPFPHPDATQAHHWKNQCPPWHPNKNHHPPAGDAASATTYFFPLPHEPQW